MTTSGETILEEIVAGLEGVTPDPWRADDNELYTIRSGTSVVADNFRKVDRDHFLRCSPDALRAIASYVADVKARAENAERERNTFKAKDASKSKLLERFRDLLLNMCDHMDDEGDRIYLGSTNDADDLKDIAQQMDAWKWDALMGQTTSDPYADLREQRTRAEAAERALAEAVAERDALKAALERLRTPPNSNSVPLPMWAAGIVKRALDNGGQG